MTVMTESRWTPKRKKQAVEALRRGDFTREEFMAANAMSDEELSQWERGVMVSDLKISGAFGRRRGVLARRSL